LAQALSFWYLPTEQLLMDYNVLLLRMGNEVVLIDTGFGAAALKAAGIAPQEITAIVLNHAHRDHIGNLSDGQGGLAYPRARVLASRVEADFWAHPDFSASRSPKDRQESSCPFGKCLCQRNASMPAASRQLTPGSGKNGTGIHRHIP